MELALEQYRQKLLGCWLGKNIGGTLGAPFECRRGVLNLDFYTQDLGGEPLPNDDLDLQLVWLNAVEKFGRRVDGSILGEYWHSYIVPNWAEYGAGKNNMRMGIVPPLSGFVNNVYRDSNGAFIRSEIWACLAPGHPEIAVQYAFEDASVDHCREGIYAEVFFAALQSAAFAESDPDRLIDIGLSYIPSGCGVTKGIQVVRQAFQGGLTWQEARKKLFQAVPGSFGMIYPGQQSPPDEPVGAIGWDAPSNAGITILGWLYGGGDFGQSLCTAVNCGEDTDCTGATLGAILGIIHGREGIPERWVAPLGDKIVTLCINLGDQGLRIPKSVPELTERILRLTPIFLGSRLCDTMGSTPGYTIEMLEGDNLFNRPAIINAWVERKFEDLLSQSPFVVKHDFVIFKAFLDYGGEPYIQAGVAKRIKLKLENNLFMQQWLNLHWHLPPGWEVLPGPQTSLPLEQYHCNIATAEIEFTLICDALTQPRYDLVLQITSNGRHTQGLIPVVLMHSPIYDEP